MTGEHREPKTAEQERRFFSEAEVREFAERCRFEIPEDERRDVYCVDGRYPAKGDRVPGAAPGAHAGYLLAGLGALSLLERKGLLGGEVSDERKSALRNLVADTLLLTVGGDPDRVRFHTDDHSKDKGVAGGCGHLAKAQESPSAYALSGADIEFLLKELVLWKGNGATEDELQGSHDEAAVVIVRSKKFSLSHQFEGVDGVPRQAFVFHETLHGEFMEELSRRISEVTEIGQDDVRAAMDEVFAAQLEATLQRLAPNHPRFIVEINDKGEISVEKAA